MSGITAVPKDAYDTSVTETLRRVAETNGYGVLQGRRGTVPLASLKSRRS